MHCLQSFSLLFVFTKQCPRLLLASYNSSFNAIYLVRPMNLAVVMHPMQPANRFARSETEESLTHKTKQTYNLTNQYKLSFRTLLVNFTLLFLAAQRHDEKKKMLKSDWNHAWEKVGKIARFISLGFLTSLAGQTWSSRRRLVETTREHDTFS